MTHSSGNRYFYYTKEFWEISFFIFIQSRFLFPIVNSSEFLGSELKYEESWAEKVVLWISKKTNTTFSELPIFGISKNSDHSRSSAASLDTSFRCKSLRGNFRSSVNRFRFILMTVKKFENVWKIDGQVRIIEKVTVTKRSSIQTGISTRNIP